MIDSQGLRRASYRTRCSTSGFPRRLCLYWRTPSTLAPVNIWYSFIPSSSHFILKNTLSHILVKHGLVPRCKFDGLNLPSREAESRRSPWSRSSSYTPHMWFYDSARPWISAHKRYSRGLVGVFDSCTLSPFNKNMDVSLPWTPLDWSDTGSSQSTQQRHVVRTLSVGGSGQNKMICSVIFCFYSCSETPPV